MCLNVSLRVLVVDFPIALSSKAADFKAEIGGVEVECEVTNSEQKSLQIALKERASALVQHLQAVLPVAGLRVRLSDEADANDLHKIGRAHV